MLSKFLTAVLSLLTMGTSDFNQVDGINSVVMEEYCYMDYILSDFRADSLQLTLLNEMEKTISNNLQQGEKMQLTIPIVIHIVHNGGPENITDAEVFQGVQNLNDAFKNVGYYDNGVGVDVEIDFCLAKRDPNGNATNGITRDANILTDMILETQDIALKNINRWEPTEYINVWVVKSITSQISGPGVAGYAYFPTSHGMPEDGIVLEAPYFGATQPNSAVLVHELGHYLGLFHTFEGGCTNNDCALDGDRICDTPPDQTTGNVPCNAPPNSCNTDTDSGFMTDQDDMISNYMDYSDLICYNQFTQNQKERMRTVVETIRESLLLTQSCTDPCASPIDAVIASGDLSINAGEQVNLMNNSSNATNYEWYLDEDLITTSEDFNFQFTVPGSYKVFLLGFNNDQNCIGRDAICIEVICNLESDFSFLTIYPELDSTLFFENLGTSDAFYEWTINGDSASAEEDFSYEFNLAGYFSICLTVYNEFCDVTECQDFIVFPDLEGCQETFFSTIDLPQEILEGHALSPFRDGSCYLLGSHEGNALLTQFSESGDILSSHFLDLPGQNDQFFFSDWDSEGFLIGSFVAVDGPTYQYIFKYDPDTEQFVWMKHMTPIDGGQRVYSFHEIEGSGDYIFNGQEVGVGLGCNGILFEVDKDNGNVIWKKSYDLGSCETFSDILHLDDQIYVTGRYNFAGGGQNKMRVGATRLNMDGTQVWSRLYVVPVNPNNARMYSNNIIEDNGDLVICGQGDLDGISVDGLHIAMIKIDTDGNVIWTKTAETPEGNTIIAREIVKLPDGYLMYGRFNSFTKGRQLFLYKTDKNGELIWSKQYGENDDETAYDLQLHGNYIYILGSRAGGGTGSIYFIRLNLDGEFEDNCEIIDDLELNVEDYLNPYEGVHPLEELNPFYDLQEVEPELQEIALESNFECSSPCEEICDNGIDDDDDGYIDCFDEDCPCNTVECSVTDLERDIASKLAWRSTQDEAAVDAIPIIGDLDPSTDSIPEVLVLASPANITSQNAPHILVFKGDGSNQDNPDRIIIPGGADGYPAVNPCVGDVNRDGIPEVIICSASSKVEVFTNYQAGNIPPMTSMVSSTENIDHPNRKPYLADFNGDGFAEVYVGDDIFEFDFSNINPELHKVLSGGSSAGVLNYNGYSQPNCSPIAADLLDSIHCAGDPDCNGIELIAGNIIYSVDMTGNDGDGYEIKVQRDLNVLQNDFNYDDGYTSVADVDLDGILDVVVAASRNGVTGVYVWNRDGLVYWFEHSTVKTGGIVCIANVYDDTENGVLTDYPEMIVCSENRLHCYNINAGNLGMLNDSWWTLTTQDASALTGTSVFDFNGDDIYEILYRDEDNLRILYGGPTPFPLGVDADRNWDSHVVGSGTFDEYPTVGDVDNDGQAEIAVTGYLTSGPNDPAADYRGRLQVFEADLLNGDPWMSARNIWNQYGYFVVNVNNDLTLPVELQAHHLEFPNIGSDYRPFNAYLAQSPIYDENYEAYLPVPDAIVHIDSVNCNLNGLTLGLTICNEGAAELSDLLPISFYNDDPTVTNADIISTQLSGTVVPVDSCVFVQLTIPFTEGIIYVVVNDDGSIPSPFDLGIDFPITNHPECIYTNNLGQIDFSLIIPSGPNLGPDASFCESGIFVLDAGPDWESYDWSNGGINQTTTVWEQGEYAVTVTDICGNEYSDTIIITIDSSASIDLGPDTVLCSGASLELSLTGFDDLNWFPNELFDCDSCDEVTITIDEEAVIYVTAVLDGCVSSDSMRIQLGDELEFRDSLSICENDSILIFGQYESTSGEYTMLVENEGLCDSIFHTYLEVELAVDLSFDVQAACENQSNGAVDLNIDPPGVYNIEWSSGATTANISELDSGYYTVIVSGEDICPSSDEVYVPNLQSAAIPYAVQNVTCFGATDGSIVFFDFPENTSFSTDGVNFNANPVFSELASGNYQLFSQSEEGCIWAYEIQVVESNPWSLILPLELEINLGDSAFLDSELSGLDSASYLWDPSDLVDCETCPDVWAFPFQTTTFYLTATDSNGCEQQQEVLIRVDDSKDVYAPNVFSPNGDGLNDIFTLYSNYKAVQLDYLRVYDRWGTLLFEAVNVPLSDLEFGWDGTFKGESLNPNVFVWSAKVKFIDNTSEVYSGDVSLIK